MLKRDRFSFCVELGSSGYTEKSVKILSIEQKWAWNQDSLEVESSEADLVSAEFPAAN